jgi:hypothetical protein
MQIPQYVNPSNGRINFNHRFHTESNKRSHRFARENQSRILDELQFGDMAVFNPSQSNKGSKNIQQNLFDQEMNLFR